MKKAGIYLLASALGIAMLGWLIFVDMQRPALAQRTDFLDTCYVAGVLCARQSFSELYPPLNAVTEARSEFSQEALKMMPLLPRDSAAVWQYPPIDAELFSLFTTMPPQLALFAWQAVGCLCLFASAYFVSRCANTKFGMTLALFVLFFPIFFCLKVGQQGIVLGVFPILCALYLLKLERPVYAGAFAAVSFLTTKYFLVAFFIAAGLFRLQRKFLWGLCVGTIAVLAVMLMITPFETTLAWLHSLQLSESFHFDPHIQHNLTIFTSVAALLLQCAPPEYRLPAKIVIYIALACLAAWSLRICWRVCEAKNLSAQNKMQIVFALAFYLMPVLQIHLLYYDLALLMPANILLWNLDLDSALKRRLEAILIATFLVVDLYFVLFAVLGSSLIQPLAFVLMLFVLNLQVLFTVNAAVAKQPNNPVFTQI